MIRISKANLRIIQSSFLIFIISLLLYRIPIYNRDAKKLEFSSSLLGTIDELWLNFLIRHYSSTTSKDNRIILLLYDDKTKDELNIQGPIPPSFFLKLLNKLTHAKAKVIAFDITLTNYGDDPDQKQFIKESISHNVIHTVHRNIDNSLIFSMDNSKLPVLGSINLGTDTIKKKWNHILLITIKNIFYYPFK